LGPTRFWAWFLVAMTVGGLVVRGLEFTHLHARWDADAYGSIVWALLLLHTTHIVTDFVTSLVLAIFLFTHPVDSDRFSDVDDDCIYWNFVVVAWLPIYALVYWAPRLMS
ncbi:MAG: cytochrome oxidase subunit, partial [Caulobacteraceae bacterium]|nr:cytochrome oxidase subunit [Caulobacteraceae bacterium]